MEKMVLWAGRAQKCMGYCAWPIKLIGYVKRAVPPEFRRPVALGLLAALVYWLFMSGAEGGAVPVVTVNSNDLGSDVGAGAGQSDTAAATCADH